MEQALASDVSGALDLAGPGDWVLWADNAEVLPRLADESFLLIYIDPPFNSGKVQRREELATVRSEDGDRVGFGGRRYRTVSLAPTKNAMTASTRHAGGLTGSKTGDGSLSAHVAPVLVSAGNKPVDTVQRYQPVDNKPSVNSKI